MKNYEEIQNIVRRTCWDEDSFKLEQFVEVLVGSGDFITNRQQLYWYDSEKGYFRNVTRELPHRSLRQYIPDDLQSKVLVRNMKAVTDNLMDQPSIYKELKSNPMHVNFLNGTLDLKEGILMKHTADYMFDYVLNCEYQENSSLAQAPEFSKYLLKSFNVRNVEAAEVKLLMEIIGYVISDCTKAKKFFLCYGPSNCGKSTFLHLVEDMVGEENVSSIGLEDMNDKFRCRDIVKARLNLLHETTTKSITKVDVLKRVVGHEKLEVEAKGIQPWSAKAKAKILMAVNSLPQFVAGAANNSLINRMVILKWHDKELDPVEMNRDLLDILIGEKNIIASVAMKELSRLIINQFSFTIPEKSTKLLDVYRDNLNSIGKFINDSCIIKADGKIFLRDIYKEYQCFSEDNGLHTMEKPAFKMTISTLEQVGFKKLRIGNKTGAGFVGISLKTLEERENQEQRESVK